MPGRKHVELVISYECDAQEDTREALGQVEQAVQDVILSSWAVNADIMAEEEL